MTVKNAYVIDLNESDVSDSKSQILRSVLILRQENEVAILEAVSTRTKKGHVKDPLHWNRQSHKFSDLAHWSRMRL